MSPKNTRQPSDTERQQTQPDPALCSIAASLEFLRSNQQGEPEPQASTTNTCSVYRLFLLMSLREYGNFPICVTSANAEFRLSDLNDCNNVFVLQTKVDCENRNMNFVVIHQCATPSRKCYCAFRHKLDFHENPDTHNLIGYYNTQNQNIIWHMLIKYAIEMRFIFVKLVGKNFPPHIFESRNFANDLDEAYKLLPKSRKINELHLKSIFYPRLLTEHDMYDFRPQDQGLKANTQLIVDGIDVVDAFENGNLETVATTCPEIFKLVKQCNSPTIDIFNEIHWSYMVCPPRDMFDHPDLKENYLRRAPPMSSDYHVALEEFIEEIKALTLFEIYTKLRSSNIIPLYASHKEAYYPVALSKRKILRWFQYQFNTDWLDVIKIIINMTNSLRHCTKQNTLLFFGPKDSGKTFVLQSFCTFAILSSNLRDFSKQFGKQHAINQRLLFLDEPKDMGKDVEELKLLCGGQQSLVDIKFRTPRELRYPPVFIAANDDIFDIDPDGIFIPRVYKRAVKPLQPEFKLTAGHVLHPYAWVEIFEDLGIWTFDE